MPVLWLSSIAGILIQLASSLVSRLLVYLGIGAVSYSGMHLILDRLTDFIFAQSGSVAGVAGQFVGLLHLTDGVNMVVSAILIKFTMMGLTAGHGTLVKWTRGPGGRSPLWGV